MSKAQGCPAFDRYLFSGLDELPQLHLLLCSLQIPQILRMRSLEARVFVGFEGSDAIFSRDFLRVIDTIPKLQKYCIAISETPELHC